LNDLTRQIWHWCIVKNIWISACHVAGVENKEADFLSRDNNSDMEWMLNTEVFQLVQNIFGNCDIDLFASKDNHQLSKYVSYLPDKYSEAVDAFSISWTNLKSYTAEKERFVSVTENSGTTTSTAKNETRSILFIRESIKNTEISDETINIINASWRDSTKQQYRNYHQKWLQLCSKKQINPFKANINNVLSFLTDLFKSGLGYSSINTARCALSSYFSLDNSVNISSNVLVKRFMKGVYTLRPALPRYNVT
jgi:hypothetical protein